MRFAPVTAQERIAARHIPAGSTEERHDEADVVVYHRSGKHGEVYAIGYAGKACRPAFNFRFKDETRRAAYVAEWVKSHRARVEQRQVHKAEKKEARHELQLGDVVYSSWVSAPIQIWFFVSACDAERSSCMIERLWFEYARAP